MPSRVQSEKSHLRGLSHAGWQQLEMAVERLEVALEAGERPQLTAYLPDESHLRRVFLIELVHADLEYRLRAEELVRVEEYLSRYPELAADSRAVVDLIEAEYRLRRQQEPPLQVSEYRDRFPNHWPELESRLSGPQADTVTQDGPPARPSGPTGWPSIPGYEILAELGRGGMGVVYQARHLALDRIVAVKMLLAGAGTEPEDLQRFQREAQAVARLRHPNIVQIYEIGEVHGQPFFSLEYCADGSLQKRLAGTTLPPAEAAALVEQLARAMQHAHEHGIIHRDLKPANVLLSTQYSVLSTPKITDFGLAKRLDDVGQTRTGAVMGTPSYMAPEQALGKVSEIGPPADVYALGAILYECLTGRAPFLADSVLEVLMLVRFQEPLAPSRLQPGVPRDLETIALKCLNKDPRRRYSSTGELADDLARFQAGEPIRARPVGALERGWKWAKRRPAVAALLLLSVIGVLTLLGLSLGFNAYLQEAVKEARADEAAARQREQEAIAGQHLAELRTEADGLVRQGREALSQERWSDAHGLMTRALDRIGDEPALSDLRDEATAGRSEAARRLDVGGRYQKFLGLRDDAVFHQTLLTGLARDEHRKAAREAANAALGLFNYRPAESLMLPGELSADEQARVRSGCYEMLLVLAEAAVPGEQGARQALDLLDSASRLDPNASRQAYHLRRARYLTMLGDREAAADQQRQAEKLKPETATDYFLVGDELYRRGQLEDAARAFSEVLEKEPRDFWAHYFLALCRLNLGRPAEAQSALTACFSLRKEFVWLYLLSGFAHAQLEEYDAAERDFKKALALPGDDQVRYGVAVNRGLMRLRQGKPTDAIAEFNQAISLKPDHYQAHANLAQAYQQMGKVPDALACMNRAITAEPDLAALYRVRARLHEQAGDTALALRDLDDAIRLQGDTPAAARDHGERARLLCRTNRHLDAVKACGTALTLRPDLVNVLPVKAEALLELGRAEDAVKALDRYLEVAPGTAEIHRRRALAKVRLKDYAGAISDYTRALALKPDAPTYTARGWLYLATEAPKLARNDFDRALALEPDSADALNGRAQARLQSGQLTEAVADAEAACRIGAKVPGVLLGAARVHVLAAGKIDAQPGNPSREMLARRSFYQQRAVELLRRAVEAQPGPERRGFWKRSVQDDPAWLPVREHAGFVELAEKYGRD